jgi:hypothetical protein
LPPVIFGFAQSEYLGIFTKIKISQQQLSRVMWNVKCFWRAKYYAFMRGLNTLVELPTKLVKSAIFWKKIFFSKKMVKWPYFRHQLCWTETAGISIVVRKYVFLVPKLLSHTHNVLKVILHVYLWNKTSLTKKLSKHYSKIEKNSCFFCWKSFGKNSKHFFFKFEIW